MRPLVAYVGPFAFPNGGAAARRILGNAQSLREAGFEVEIASGQMPGSDFGDSYDGFTVRSLGERTAEHFPPLLKRLVYVGMGVKTVTYLEAMHPRPRAVILYSGYAAYLTRLLPWCRANGVPLIFDAVEWYRPHHWYDWPHSLHHWNSELALRYFAMKTGNIIAISRFLEDHFSAHGCQTVRVPPTLDTVRSAGRLAPARDGPLTLAYTGLPGHKDLFDPYLRAVLDIDPTGKRLRLVVAGPSLDEVLAFPALRTKGARVLPPCVKALGPVPHEEAISLTRRADFTLLLRPDNRTSRAGFPTKVVESLSVGTPVICNHTSDLSLHVRDGVEGLVCGGNTVEALKDAINRALELTPAELGRMRRAARAQAEQSFDYRRHTEALAEFVSRALPPGRRRA